MPKRSSRAPEGSPPVTPFRVWLLALSVLFGLSLFVLHSYERVRDPLRGWTKLIRFGVDFEARALPRLRAVPHYVFRSAGSRLGYDGQFYAQLALDPTLRDPAFDRALDNPAYRARRIGLPALAYAAGGGDPGRIVQVYALANLAFWFGLGVALLALLRPWAPQRIACLAAALLTGGVLNSMKQSLTDLPAAALLMAGLALGSWGGHAALAAAVLTRETSLLAAWTALDFRRPFTRPVWARNGRLLALAVGPFAAWFVYVKLRFGGLHWSSGGRNFALPLQAAVGGFAENFRWFTHEGAAEAAQSAGLVHWLCVDLPMHEMLTAVSLGIQGVYLLLRRDWSSAVWRTGVVYLALGCVLGPAVWEGSGAASRVLLPMTLPFYVLLARERAAGWFWPFFVFGGLPIPYGVYEFWRLR